MEHLLVYSSALIIGIVLGLIGGGGSILTVPVLVYFMGMDEKLATGYSLFIVGVAAAIGMIQYAKKDLVDFKTAAIFALPAIPAVYIARAYIVPAIPEHIGTIGGLEITDGLAIMVFFAIIMLLAAISMIRGRQVKSPAVSEQRYNYPLIMGEGILVGLLTGIVGAGGGFLIIPALVLLAGLSMKLAVGTSLLIIAAKSLLGFLGDVMNAEQVLDWAFLGVFSLLAVIGILGGGYLSQFVPGGKLKRAFGWFVLVMGSYIIIDEIIL